MARLPSKAQLLPFLKEMRALFKQEPALIELNPESRRMVVMGDVHSDYETVQHILQTYVDKNTIFIGLGDYVDRPANPDEGLKTILALFHLKKKHPRDVFLLRGNHECREMNSMYGFRMEVLKRYDDEVWRAFNAVFEKMPLVIRTTNGVLLLHGGLPEVDSLDDIKRAPKVKDINESPIVDQILWNDCQPRSRKIELSDRGVPSAFTFGQTFFSKIMKRLKAHVLIRGHQFPMKGVLFSGRCLTLQTTRLYEDFPHESSKYYAD